MNEPILATGVCQYQKLHGTVLVTPSKLILRQEGSISPTLLLGFENLTAVQVNAPSSVKHLLKLVPSDDFRYPFSSNGILIQFSTVYERDVIKTVLVEAFAKFRAKVEKPEPMDPKLQKLKDHLLERRKDIATIYTSLVTKGNLTEEDFWQPRQSLIAEQESIESQRKGLSSTLASEIRPSQMIGGEIKYTLTPSIIQSIFVQKSEVYEAYVALVPHSLSEKEFWTNYFQSQVYKEALNDTISYDESNPIDHFLMKRQKPVSGEFIDDPDQYPLVSFDDDLNETESDQIQDSLIKKFNRHSTLILKTLTKGIQIKEPDVEFQFSKDENSANFQPLSISNPSIYNTEPQYTSNHVDFLDPNVILDSFQIDSCLISSLIEVSPVSSVDSFSISASSEHLSFYYNACEILRHFWANQKIPLKERSQEKMTKLAHSLTHLVQQLKTLLDYKRHGQTVSYNELLRSLEEPLSKALSLCPHVPL